MGATGRAWGKAVKLSLTALHLYTLIIAHCRQKKRRKSYTSFLHNILHNKLHNFDTARTGRKDKTMRNRNVKAVIDGVKVNPYYDIDLNDVNAILEYSKREKKETYTEINPANLVVYSFLYGYAMGQRATTAEQRRTARGVSHDKCN